jgi:hypothetical protein
MRRIAVAMASLGLLLGIGFAFAAAWSWFDPVGIQMANDVDPFGTPPNRSERAYVFVFAAAVAATSARILWLRQNNDSDDIGDDNA